LAKTYYTIYRHLNNEEQKYKIGFVKKRVIAGGEGKGE
jgi:hypothetical protein